MLKLTSLIGLVIASFIGTIVSARGVFASRDKLLSMSKLIGTKNPAVARVACVLGLVLCTPVWGSVAVVLVLIIREELGNS